MLQILRKSLRRGERGFTLIELLIVVAIIAILAAILIPNFLRARAQSMVAASKGNLKNLGTALESYFVDNTQYPNTGALSALINSPQNYIRAVPTDPCTRGQYTYTAYNSNQTYVVETVATWAGTPCGSILAGIFYTPSGGLGETP